VTLIADNEIFPIIFPIIYNILYFPVSAIQYYLRYLSKKCQVFFNGSILFVFENFEMNFQICVGHMYLPLGAKELTKSLSLKINLTVCNKIIF